nr:tRNA (adenosine(37)-N6)-threonylcarbamoyltransferase complex dimerization subunit type 1 TsaB [Corynebacterium lactis]
MNILAVDTSTPQVTAGIVRVGADGDVATLASQLHLDARAHNEVLVPLIQQALADAALAPADLDAVVVGCGPGPFTGLRVGMATAASYADALGIACHGICSLDALAAGAGDELVVTDARRREVYFAAYRDGEHVFGPAVAKASDVLGLVAEQVPGFSPEVARGSLAHAEQVLPGKAVEALPQPADMVRVAGFADGTQEERPGPLVPLYLRARTPRSRNR